MELGSLEREVMNVVWAGESVSVRDVYEAMERRLAYTTIMTTLDRLHRKGVLDREQEGRAFVYRTRITREQIALNGLQRALARVTDSFRNDTRPVMACLLDAVTEHDLLSLDELEKMIQERRKADAKAAKE
jgi:predicted transcriptional regulator